MSTLLAQPQHSQANITKLVKLVTFYQQAAKHWSDTKCQNRWMLAQVRYEGSRASLITFFVWMRTYSQVYVPLTYSFVSLFVPFGYFLRIFSGGYFSDLDGFINLMLRINFPIFWVRRFFWYEMRANTSTLIFLVSGAGGIQMYFRKKSENASAYVDCW